MIVEIYADLVCPWCFLGSRRLDRALALRPGLAVERVWQPFQLNPRLPAAGIDRRAYLSAKFGGPERARALYGVVETAGQRDGIAFAFERIGRTPNTLDAHRVLRFAARHSRATPVAEALFQAYFCDGLDIGDRGVLATLAAQAGLDRDEARAFLDSGELADEVRTLDAFAREGGISGVPYFVFNRRYALAGAQDPDAFLPILDALAAEMLEPMSRVAAQ